MRDDPLNCNNFNNGLKPRKSAIQTAETEMIFSKHGLASRGREKSPTPNLRVGAFGGSLVQNQRSSTPTGASPMIGFPNSQSNSNLKLNPAGLSNARQKQKNMKLGIPTLDFSNLKQVKEYKDWFGYS